LLYFAYFDTYLKGDRYTLGHMLPTYIVIHMHGEAVRAGNFLHKLKVIAHFT
jgi:hypothetical protein